ncbi:MAG: hypothetical protein M3Y53_04705, partial [Thermoproteota archaeon]|nr:hypothetical protein [Thermoproteota archaeon]
MSSPSDNVPIDAQQNVPIELLARLQVRRVRISSKAIQDLAVEKFEKCKEGMTFRDLRDTFGITQRRAQRKLKNLCENDSFRSEKKVLFVPEQRKPQQYYPKCLKAEVNEYIAKKRNVLVQPTGVTPSKHPLSNALEAQKAQNFLDILVRLPFAPRYIHKLLLMLSIYKEYYTTLEHDPRHINKAKIHQERIGRTLTTYTYSPNGTVEIAVACSDNPFRLETDDDVAILFSFFGQVKDRMLYHLGDPRERMIPPIIDWRLKQCDVNKDIEITDKMQFTLPDIQLKYAGRVFRAYVKLLGEKAAFRCEESLKVDLALMDGFDHIRDPNKEVKKKLDYLIDLVKANKAPI